MRKRKIFANCIYRIFFSFFFAKLIYYIENKKKKEEKEQRKDTSSRSEGRTPNILYVMYDSNIAFSQSCLVNAFPPISVLF